MKKIVSVIAVAFVSMLVANHAQAQMKVGFISLGELIGSMPESKKADTAFNDYRVSLQQQLAEYQNEYYEQDSLLRTKDTLKFTKPQLEVKRRNLLDLQIKIQGFNDQAQQAMQQKQQELLAPIQKKALDAVQAVAKENGYNYVMSKEALYVSPPGDDLMALVKRKLGVK
ncbi:MAG TPA: OmpH family outer membrane protein [Puia sp.]|nr:OmpH family outer membrane protein [Puia sp.]